MMRRSSRRFLTPHSISLRITTIRKQQLSSPWMLLSILLLGWQSSSFSTMERLLKAEYLMSSMPFFLRLTPSPPRLTRALYVYFVPEEGVIDLLYRWKQITNTVFMVSTKPSFFEQSTCQKFSSQQSS
jgi:hypothetical protein